MKPLLPVFRESDIQQALEDAARRHLHSVLSPVKEDEIRLAEDNLEVSGDLLAWAPLNGTLTMGIFGHDSMDAPYTATGSRVRERFAVAVVPAPGPATLLTDHAAPAEVNIDSENLPLLSMGGLPVLRWVDVESSFIEALRYDPWAQELEVRIRRGAHEPSAFYTHSRVAFGEFVELMVSESKGAHYNAYIKGRKLASVSGEKW